MIRHPGNPTILPAAPLVPPAVRSRTARGLAVAASQGRFALQVCADCGRSQYPPREACLGCLGGRLNWRDVPNGGVLSAATIIRISTDPYFRQHTPWRTTSATGPRPMRRRARITPVDAMVAMATLCAVLRIMRDGAPNGRRRAWRLAVGPPGGGATGSIPRIALPAQGRI